MRSRGGAHRLPDQRGIALSSPLALVAASAVLVAGVGFVVSGDPDEPAAQVAAPVRAVPAPPEPSPTAPEPVIKEKKKAAPKKPAVRRGDTYVEVYNNSGISGLAGRTAKRASGAGWQVVGSDNWYGTIPANTVYFPPRLRAAARLLGRDLGVRRLKPAISPMRMDRLTVILTGDTAP